MDSCLLSGARRSGGAGVGPSAPPGDGPHCSVLTASLSASRTKGQSLARKAKATSRAVLGAWHAGEGQRRAHVPDARGLSYSESGRRV